MLPANGSHMFHRCSPSRKRLIWCGAGPRGRKPRWLQDLAPRSWLQSRGRAQDRADAWLCPSQGSRSTADSGLTPEHVFSAAAARAMLRMHLRGPNLTGGVAGACVLVALGLVLLASFAGSTELGSIDLWRDQRVSNLPWLTWISRSARDCHDQIDTLGLELSLAAC